MENLVQPPPVEKSRINYTSLKRFQELRIDIEDRVKLSLEKGKAEIFGTEISSHTSYLFSNTSTSIFTFHEAEIRLEEEKKEEEEGGKTHFYVPSLPSDMKSHPMLQYLLLHGELEKIRMTSSEGPVVLVIGEKDSGKSALSKTLFSYATRRKHRCCFVDLSCDVGTITLPGNVSCVISEEPYCPKDGFHLNIPLVYSFGCFTPHLNEELYIRMCSNLSKSLNERRRRDSKLHNGGVIIDTPTFQKNQREILHKIVKMFQVTHLLLLGEENRLYHDLKKVFWGKSSSSVKVFRTIAKTGGAVEKTAEKRKQSRSTFVHNYFYGPDKRLSPSPVVIAFDDCEVVKLGGDWYAPESALPIGMKSVVDRCRVSSVAVTPELNNSVLSVSNAEKRDDVLNESICGFILVKKVDVKKREIHVLQPSPNKVEKRFLIVGDLKWIDQ